MRMRTIGAVGGVIVSVFVLLTGVADAQAAPPNADLAVTVVGSPPVATIGDTVTFVITAINNGPDAVPGVEVASLLPVELSNLSWTCSSSGGATCSVASGTGDILEMSDFAALATLTVTITATVPALPSTGQIVDQASVNTQAPGFLDSDPTNNFAQAIVQVIAAPTTTTTTPTTTTTTTTAATTTTPPTVPPATTTAPASTTSTPTPSTALPATATTADVNDATTTGSTALPTTGEPLRLMTISALLAVALGCGVFVAAVGRRRGQD